MLKLNRRLRKLYALGIAIEPNSGGWIITPLPYYNGGAPRTYVCLDYDGNVTYENMRDYCAPGDFGGSNENEFYDCRRAAQIVSRLIKTGNFDEYKKIHTEWRKKLKRLLSEWVVQYRERRARSSGPNIQIKMC